MAAFEVDWFVTGQPVDRIIAPVVCPLFIAVNNIGVDPWIPAGAVGAIFLDQVGALAEPPVVLRVVTARLGDIAIQVEEHLVAHDLFVVDFGALGNRLADQWVGILAFPLIVEIPGHVVDAGTGVGNL